MIAQSFGDAAGIELFGLLGYRELAAKLKFGLHVEVKSCDLNEYLIFR